MVLNTALRVSLLKTIGKFHTLLMSLQFTLTMSFSNLKSAIEIEICNRNTRKTSEIYFSGSNCKRFSDYIVLFSLLLTLNMFCWHYYFNLNRIICTEIIEKQFLCWNMFWLAFTQRALYCMKSVRIRSFSGPIFPHSDWIWRDTSRRILIHAVLTLSSNGISRMIKTGVSMPLFNLNWYSKLSAYHKNILEKVATAVFSSKPIYSSAVAITFWLFHFRWV